MREIKFSYILQHDETGRIVDKRYDIEDIENFEFIDEPHGYTLVVRRQFTGLLDKNGVEVFEGDVIKHNIANGMFIVIFKYAQFQYNEIGCDWVGHISSEDIKKCEVIGNIFQNEELLNDSK